MMKQEGRISIAGIIVLILLVYGGFVAVKLISANLMEKQIENEVVDTFGLLRGHGFTPEIAEKEIMDIFNKHGVIYDSQHEGTIIVVIEKGKIKYEFRYTVEVDLILFKHRKDIEVKNEMRNYT